MAAQIGGVSREIRGNLYMIGLNRASKLNAFDSHMIDDLSLALTEYEDNPEFRCAIVFAHGENFTAGLDLVELQSKISKGIFPSDSNLINPWGTSGRARKKPVVVAVHGYCYTAGIELMLNADITIAHSNTNFAQLEVLRGILPFGGATSRFIKAAGWNAAMRYLLTGDSFDAQKALEMNLIYEITNENPLNRAVELAERIAKAAPLAVQATLASAKESVQQGEIQAFNNLTQHLLPLLSSEDAQEGVLAMIERREAQFKGQ